MPYGVVSGVGQGMGILDGMEIVKGEGAVFGDFVVYLCESAPIVLSFGVVSGVGCLMNVFYRGPCATRGMGGFEHFCPIGLNGIF